MGEPTLRERVPFRGNLVEADLRPAQPPLHAPGTRESRPNDA
jgi:hypothetical protein